MEEIARRLVTRFIELQRDDLLERILKAKQAGLDVTEDMQKQIARHNEDIAALRGDSGHQSEASSAIASDTTPGMATLKVA